MSDTSDREALEQIADLARQQADHLSAIQAAAEPVRLWMNTPSAYFIAPAARERIETLLDAIGKLGEK